MDLREKYLSVKRRLFDKVIGAKLNPRQADAVFSVFGPLLVLAGAGSGKTTVLVNRINFIIKYGNAYYDDTLPLEVNDETVQNLEEALLLPPEEIEPILSAFAASPCAPWRVLAFTFTNKAAREIKERLTKSLGDSEISDAIWAGTFHSVCLKILRKHGDRLGYRQGFSIYDEQDKKKLISDCMEKLEIDESRISPKIVIGMISKAKDKLQSPSELEVGMDPRYTDVQRIYELYQQKLMHNNAVDFDDIIMKTVELLQEYDDVREYYQSKFEYVLVDEYQDTNYAQFVLTKLLSEKYRNIMVVGDDDQSIYRFRGATVENILGFDKTFPDAKVVKLEQNYRSTETILEAANAIIRNNGNRHGKTLWCDKGEGEKITLREASDQIDEGKYIIDRINAGVRLGRKYSDYAVLYRINEMARSLETTFAKSGVPYKILGGNRFYDRKEVKDMLAYLTLTNSKTDDQRLKRIINEPKRKIGAATVEAVERLAEQTGQYMFGVMRAAHQYEALKKSADKLFAFTEIIMNAELSFSEPSVMLNELFISSGYKAMLEAEGIEGESRIDNVNELIAGAIEYEKRCREAGEEPSVAGYLDEVNLVSDLDKYDDEADSVVLMTIHSAKGLEFPVVFLAGMEDGIFPSDRNIGNEAEMSEERRLAYVAITRAKEKLYITYAKDRMMYGRFGTGMLSCFIRKEMPASLVERDRPTYSPFVPGRGVGAGYGKNTAYGSSGFGRPQHAAGRAGNSSSSARTPSGAGKYGIKALPVGSVVNHEMFGEGVIISAKDMAGDVLYEVKFAVAGTKKLLATYARLTLKK